MKTTLFLLLSIGFCNAIYSQTEGQELAIQLLEEANMDHESYSPSTNISRAMTVLDSKKESGSIDESSFQSKLSILMEARDILVQQATVRRVEISDQRRKEYEAKMAKGDYTDMYDLSMQRLKTKLDKGEIAQEQYDARLKELKEKQKAYRAKKG